MMTEPMTIELISSTSFGMFECAEEKFGPVELELVIETRISSAPLGSVWPTVEASRKKQCFRENSKRNRPEMTSPAEQKDKRENSGHTAP